MHHPTDRIAHNMAFVTPVVEHWLEREIKRFISMGSTITMFHNTVTTEMKKILKHKMVKKKEEHFWTETFIYKYFILKNLNPLITVIIIYSFNDTYNTFY